MRFKQLYEAGKASSKIQTKNDVLNWLAQNNSNEHLPANKNKYADKAYDIYSDLSVDILSGHSFHLDTRFSGELTELPIHFSKMEGADFSVVGSSISSWKNFPTDWHGGQTQRLIISESNITSFHGMPEFDGTALLANMLDITSLEGLKLGSRVRAVQLSDNDKLSSLKGLPPHAGNGYLSIGGEALESLEGLPPEIDSFRLKAPKMKSLSKIHRHLKKCHQMVLIGMDSLEAGLLGLLKIEDLSELTWNEMPLEVTKALIIVKKHLKSDKEDKVLACQSDLIDAGLDEFATL